jgi:hypothetical protein
MILDECGMISEESARRELWTSFASLIRSYVAAAQIGVPDPSVLLVQPSEDDLELVSRQRTIRLHMSAGNAEGYWAMYASAAAGDDSLLAEGAFRIGMDGLLDWTGLPGRQEMDAVAEALATLALE